MQIRDAIADDASAIVAIYNHFILNTTVSFEEQAVKAEEMAQRISDVQAAGLPWLVIEQDQVVVGYALSLIHI